MVKKAGAQLDLDFEVKVAADGVKRVVPFRECIIGPTIVSVYMRNNTGSCDKQMISLSESYDTLRSMGFSILGVSKDTVGSHLKYAAKHSIGFPLVSDPEHRFARATDSLIEKKMYGKTFWGPSRSAYVIGEDGILLGVIESINAAAHGEEVKALMKGLGGA